MSECFDRGAKSTIQFERCARGFLLRVGSPTEICPVYAFDRIEDVAAWFVEQYSEPERRIIDPARRHPRADTVIR